MQLKLRDLCYKLLKRQTMKLIVYSFKAMSNQGFLATIKDF